MKNDLREANDAIKQIDTINELIKDFNFFSKKNVIYKNGIQKLLSKYNINRINDLKTKDLKKFQKEFYDVINKLKKAEERFKEEMREIILENEYSIY
jgi:hypothetical protein